MSPYDASSSHVIYKFCTDHPYKQSCSGTIFIYGASQLHLKFDPRCNTESNIDNLIYYKNEEMTKPIGKQFSGNQFDNFSFDGKRIFYKFQVESSSTDKFGWLFEVKASFTSTISFSTIENNRYEIVSLPDSQGINLLKRYLSSDDDRTRRFAALTISNICMSKKCKSIIAVDLGFDFFLNLPNDDISTRMCAVCLSELLEDESNRYADLYTIV